MRFIPSLIAVCLLAYCAGLTSNLQAAERKVIRFTGTVTDATGKPLEGATVQINGMSEIKVGELKKDIRKFEYFTKDLATQTDATGKYELPLIYEPTDLADARCELWFEKKGYVRVTKEIKFNAHKDKEATASAELNRGKVLAGNIHLKMPAMLRRKDKTEPPHHPELLKVENTNYTNYYKTDDDGNFEVYVPEGEYRLIAGFGGDKVVVEKVQAGTTGIQISTPEFVWSEETVGKEFDRLWEMMDKHYSYFFLKTNVDWLQLKEEYRPKAAQAKNPKELAEAIQPMLEKLHDLHVWIEYPGGGMGSLKSTWDYNGNGNAIRSTITAPTICGKYAAVGRTKPDGFGYFLMIRQSNATKELVKQAAEAIEKMKDTPGFIVDLRRANGGSEPWAMEIAKLFCAKKAVYAKSKYRNGPKHTDFTQDYERTIEPAEHPYTKPVVCILGPGTVSSGEGFAKMMMCLPNVTTVGLPTRGASGNPQPWPMGETEVVVTFSRWVDMLPNGETFEGRGIPPQIEVNEPADIYKSKDPTLEKALQVLRDKVQVATKPGNN